MKLVVLIYVVLLSFCVNARIFEKTDKERFLKFYTELNEKVDQAMTTADIIEKMTEIQMTLEKEVKNVSVQILKGLPEKDRRSFQNSIASWDNQRKNEYLLIEETGAKEKGSISGINISSKKVHLLKDRILFLYENF